MNKHECVILMERWQSDECMNAIMGFFSSKGSKLWFIYLTYLLIKNYIIDVLWYFFKSLDFFPEFRRNMKIFFNWNWQTLKLQKGKDRKIVLWKKNKKKYSFCKKSFRLQNNVIIAIPWILKKYLKIYLVFLFSFFLQNTHISVYLSWL